MQTLQKSLFGWLAGLLVLLQVCGALAGTTGKIIGRVVDKDTGDPLPGVNIVIEGTTLGAAADEKGNYVILNVPPGTYTLKASMIGYKIVVKRNVKVSVDLTTEINFELEPTVIQGETVVVEARRPLVERDRTSRLTIVDAKVFDQAPVREYIDIVAIQAGMTTDRAGVLHMRGGRGGEVVFMVDGVSIQDPYYRGGPSLILDKYTIQELQVLTGTYSAEYGRAMSGIVNIVLKEGGPKYQGRIEWESDYLNPSPYRKKDALTRDSIRDTLDVSKYNPPPFPYELAEPKLIGEITKALRFKGYLSANLSGPMPFIPNLSFFIAGRFSNSESYLPFGYDKRREITAKFTYRGIPKVKINFVFHRNWRYYKPYVHVWKYNPDGLEDRKSFAWREGIEVTHALGAKSFYKIQLYRFRHLYHRYNPRRWAIFREVRDPQTGHVTGEMIASNWVEGVRNADGFYLYGDRGRYEYNVTTTWSFKVDLTSQIHPRHEIKMGFHIQSHEVFRDRWRYPWPGTAHYYEHFTRYPYEVAGYIQDKMEYSRFVLNVGLRYDYFNANATMWRNILDPGWVDEQGVWHYYPEYPVDPYHQLSPRIGLAYPVTDRMVLHSSYGHFYQIPGFYEIYKHHDITIGAPLVGNPRLKPEKTVAFEFGIRQQLGSEYVFEVNAYFKDVHNLAASRFYAFYPYNYTVFDNSDYASIKGIDFSLEKRYGRYFSGIITYTYGVAMGNESSSRTGYDYYRGVNVRLRPNREYYLDFDRRHDISGNILIQTPEDFGPKVFGFRPFADLQINTLFELASGLPYTPYIEEVERENIYIPRNTARKPWTKEVSIRVQKEIRLKGRTKLAAFLRVRNLFNAKNVLYVWTRTGKPWDAGPLSSYTKDRQMNPANVGAPRRITVGLRVYF